MTYRSEVSDMTNERLMKIHSIVTDFWKCYREHYENMADTDEWWDDAVGSMNKLAEKYDNDRVALDMAITLFNDLERICKHEISHDRQRDYQQLQKR